MEKEGGQNIVDRRMLNACLARNASHFLLSPRLLLTQLLSSHNRHGSLCLNVGLGQSNNNSINGNGIIRIQSTSYPIMMRQGVLHQSPSAAEVR